MLDKEIDVSLWRDVGWMDGGWLGGGSERDC